MGRRATGTTLTQCWFLWVGSTALFDGSSALSHSQSSLAEWARNVTQHVTQNVSQNVTPGQHLQADLAPNVTQNVTQNASQNVAPDQHLQELLNARMEKKFERVRRAWALAKLDQQAHLQEVTEQAVKKVDENYSKKMADIKGVGLLMQQQALEMQGVVTSSKASGESMHNETLRQRNLTKSMVADIKASLVQAEKVPLVEDMHTNAVIAEAVSTDVNQIVADTLTILDNASTISSRASMIALQAVHQASQNTLKLKSIRTLIDKVGKEVTKASAAEAR